MGSALTKVSRVRDGARENNGHDEIPIELDVENNALFPVDRGPVLQYVEDVIDARVQHPRAPKLPRKNPDRSYYHKYWKSPLRIVVGDSCASVPMVIHIINPEFSVPPDNTLLRVSKHVYVQRLKSRLLHPHHSQDLIGKGPIRLHLEVVNDQHKEFAHSHESKVLMEKVRYLTLTLEHDSEPEYTDYARIRVTLDENHGNVRRKLRHKQRPLVASHVFVDHQRDSLIIHGMEFFLTIGVPHAADVERKQDDPGARVIIGMYVRELDTDPEVKIKWYVNMRLRDIPASAARASRGVNQ